MRWLLLASAVLLAALAIGTARDRDFWSTPAQRGDALMARKQFAEAAKTYDDPYRQGVALYRGGDFKAAAEAFGRATSAEAAYDRGNAFVLLGKYDLAIKSYDRALTLRPDWPEAADNRGLAVLRRDRLKTKGGDATGGQVAPDDIVVNNNKGQDGQPTTTDGGAPLSDQELRGMWLRNVQTRPADFLRAKFAFQQAAREKGS
jgi:Ca-activated chloride channel family protein